MAGAGYHLIKRLNKGWRVMALIAILCYCPAAPLWSFDLRPMDPGTNLQSVSAQGLKMAFDAGPREAFLEILFRAIRAPAPQRVREVKMNADIPIQTIILEAVGEGREGMLAVAEVIRNRAKLFGKTFDEVCLAPKQFSGWNDRAAAKKFLSEHKDFYKEAEKAWRDSEKSRLVKGATDYHADYVDPYWAKSYRKVAKISKHIFYTRPHFKRA